MCAANAFDQHSPGTPRDLKMRSDQAGAITVKIVDGDGKALAAKIGGVQGVEHTALISERPLTVRAYPRKNAGSDDVARAIGDLALRERWPLVGLHVEEGRLDEVFRSITLPETVQEAKP